MASRNSVVVLALVAFVFAVTSPLAVAETLAPAPSPTSDGVKWVMPPVPCTQEDCRFICRHPDLLPHGCPGIRCICLQ